MGLAERFWSKVDRGFGLDDCWEWTGGRDRRGYGRFGVRDGVAKLAHRVAYELAVGPIPDGLHILHRCDNPACVNPDHLRAGTQIENIAEMDHRGRRVNAQPRGEDHPRAKLTVTDVAVIREWAPAGWSYADLAAAFGVSKGLIGRILRGEIWRHA